MLRIMLDYSAFFFILGSSSYFKILFSLTSNYLFIIVSWICFQFQKRYIKREDKILFQNSLENVLDFQQSAQTSGNITRLSPKLNVWRLCKHDAISSCYFTPSRPLSVCLSSNSLMHSLRKWFRKVGYTRFLGVHLFLCLGF